MAMTVMLRATEQKARLSYLHQDLLDGLSAIKSDKYKPVRELAHECIQLVR